MKNTSKILLLFLMIFTLFSCEEGTKNGSNSKMYFVSYTDKNGEDIFFGNNDIMYSFMTPTHENNFVLSKKNVLFQIPGDATPENIVGKYINIMISEGNSDEFVAAKSFKCKVDGFEYQKKGMFDDKVYKLTGTFNTDNYKNGKLSLQVYM